MAKRTPNLELNTLISVLISLQLYHQLWSLWYFIIFLSLTTNYLYTLEYVIGEIHPPLGFHRILYCSFMFS